MEKISTVIIMKNIQGGTGEGKGRMRKAFRWVGAGAAAVLMAR
jgi:hypothetical protein